jgi:uncharacterized membrane protein (DUF106 family)
MLEAVPAWLQMGLAGAITGVLSMLIYARLSPQQDLAVLKDKGKQARRELNAYEGTDMAEVWRLTRQSMSLGLQQMRCVLVPTVVAGIPILIIMMLIEPQVEDVLNFGPGWMRAWYVVFIGTLSISAFAVKLLFDIE